MFTWFWAGAAWYIGQVLAQAGITLLFVAVVIAIAMWRLHHGDKP